MIFISTLYLTEHYKQQKSIGTEFQPTSSSLPPHFTMCKVLTVIVI